MLMEKAQNIIWRRNQSRMETIIGRIDCYNIAEQFYKKPDDPDYWAFSPGGFRETVFLLMLTGL